VRNAAGAYIKGGVRGAVQAWQAAGTIFNAGTITGSEGVWLLQGGYLGNSSQGKVGGLAVFNQNATVRNAGALGNSTYGLDIIGGGGVFTNLAGGVISGAIAVSGGGAAAALTIDNFGTLASTNGATGTAVAFGNSSAVLVVESGSTIVGTVAGGGGTLEATGGATLAGLGSEYVGFGTVEVPAGGAATLAGSNTVATGVMLVDAGTLTNAGTLAVAGNLVVDPATLVNSGAISGAVTLAGGSYLDNLSGATINAGNVAAVLGTGGAVTIADYGAILGFQGVQLQAGGVVDIGSSAHFGGVISAGDHAIYTSTGATGSVTIANYGTLVAQRSP